MLDLAHTYKILRSSENKFKYSYCRSQKKNLCSSTFYFCPILNFTNYIKFLLFMRVRLIGFSALLGISIYIRIVKGGDGRCLLLLIAFLI